MRCFVTGITGFIGSNLAVELLARGYHVVGFARPNSSLKGIADLDIEIVRGDITDKDTLLRALRRCDLCFHVAASYKLWDRDYKSMYITNVQGTRTVLEAAITAGCTRIVYTSTVGCIGLPRCEGGKIIPADETTPVEPTQLSNHYKRSKWEAEQIAIKLAAQGHPIIIVNPTAPIGPRDVKPTPTGQIIVDFLNRKMPAYVDTGLNWVHVRDVALGHILAAEKGRLGERYILGNLNGNLTLAETFQLLERITGIPAPRHQIPYFVAFGFALLSEIHAKLTGKPPKAPLAGVRMAKYKMFFNPHKAVFELGLPQTPIEQAFKDAVSWFVENGYVRTPLPKPTTEPQP